MQIKNTFHTKPLTRPSFEKAQTKAEDTTPESPVESVTLSEEYPYTGTTHLMKLLGAASAITFVGSVGAFGVGLFTGNGGLMGKSALFAASSAMVGFSVTSQFE